MGHHVIPSWDTEHPYYYARNLPEFQKADLTVFEHSDEHFALWVETGDWRHWRAVNVKHSIKAGKVGGSVNSEKQQRHRKEHGSNIGRAAVESGRLEEVRLTNPNNPNHKEHQKNAAKAAGRVAVESGQIYSLHTTEHQKKASARANRRVKCVETGYETSNSSRTKYEKKLGRVLTWVDVVNN